MSGVDIRVVADPSAAAAELLAEAARGAGHLALSGGGTVGRTYELAAEALRDWTGAHVWFGDDRAVPPDDEDSNYRLVREALLDRLERAPLVHRIHGEDGAEEAASRYERELGATRLDLALNGIGVDGHTASLFPHAPTLDAAGLVAAAAPGLAPWVPRVTLTRRAFADAALLVYLVVGEAKAEAVRRAFAEPPDAATPASLVRGRETVALLDAAAASRLP